MSDYYTAQMMDADRFSCADCGKPVCGCSVTAPTPDAVAQARENVLMCVTDCEQSVGESFTQEEYDRDRASLEASLDALIAAVRAECAAKVRKMRSASASLPAYTDVTYGQQQGEIAAFDAVLAILEAQP